MATATAASNDALSALLLPHADGAASHLLRGSAASTSSSYLSTLTTQPLATLTASPAALSATLSTLDAQLSSLCLRQVGAMSSLHSASRRLEKGTTELELRTQQLLDVALPALEEATANFALQSAASVQERRDAQALAAQSGALTMLLGTPALLEACVKAKLADDALALALHVAKLAGNADWGNSATLRSIEAECTPSLRQLRAQLLAALEAPSLRGAAARRTVRHLRALRSLDRDGAAQLSLPEHHLALSLLRARMRVLNAALESAAPREETANVPALRGYITAWREHVLETLALYPHLFPEAQHACLLSAFLSRAQEKLLERLAPLPLHASVQTSAEEASSFASDLAALHTQLSYTSSNLAKHGLILHPRATQLLLHASTALFSAALPRPIERAQLVPSQGAAILMGQIDVPHSPIHNATLPALTALRVFAPLQTRLDVISEFEATLTRYLDAFFEQAQTATTTGQSSAPPLRIDGIEHSLASEQALEREERAEKAVQASLLRADVAAVQWARTALQQGVYGMLEAELLQPEERLKEALGRVESWAEEQERKWSEGERTLEDNVRSARREEERRHDEEREVARREEEARVTKVEEERKINEERERLEREKEAERIREEETRRAEQEALERERKEEEERQAEAARVAEEERVAEEKRLAEEQRLAQEKRLKEEQERLAEEERIAEEQRLASEQAEAARQAELERIEKEREAAAAKQEEARLEKEREDVAAAAAKEEEEARIAAAAQAEEEQRRIAAAAAAAAEQEREEAERAAAEETARKAAAEALAEAEKEHKAEQDAAEQRAKEEATAAAAVAEAKAQESKNLAQEETERQTEAQRSQDAEAAAAAAQLAQEEEEEAAAEAERARKRAERALAREVEQSAAAAVEASQLELKADTPAARTEAAATPKKLSLAEKLQLKKEERERKDREAAAAAALAVSNVDEGGTSSTAEASSGANGAPSETATDAQALESETSAPLATDDTTNGAATPPTLSATPSAATSAAPSEAGDEEEDNEEGETTTTTADGIAEVGKSKGKKKKKRKGKGKA